MSAARQQRRCRLAAVLAMASLTALVTASSAEAAKLNGSSLATATVMDVEGAIGPASAHYVIRGIEAAQASNSRLVILRIDTPGGLDTSMRDIIRSILASEVPVVSYVAPSGARAASAGTYILYASHVAAMAPATNLGAATPVSIGGGDAAPEPDSSPKPGSSPESGSSPQPGTPTEPATKQRPAPPAAPEPEHSRILPAGSAMEHKVVNDAVAYIRGLAELRGRNADWAEQAVRGAASLSATAALKANVIDVIARDVPDLLAQLDGREVRVANETVKLHTRDLAVKFEKPDWRTELLSVITHPTVAYGLLLIGIYGLLFEGYNPGAVFPGVVGAISLLIALFAFQILSVNYAGLALVILGAGMIAAEFFFPAYGSLGLGGLIGFVVGSLILFDSDVPGMNIARPVIAAVATAGALVIALMTWIASRSVRRPVVSGVQGMLGASAEVFESFTGRGRVRFGGEIWNAHSAVPLTAGQIVRITKVDGLTVWVEPV